MTHDTTQHIKCEFLSPSIAPSSGQTSLYLYKSETRLLHRQEIDERRQTADVNHIMTPNAA